MNNNVNVDHEYAGEFLCFCLLFICNYLGITGVRKHTPYLLVPWLGVYMVGIISCYIASFMYFLTVYYEDKISADPILPAMTGFRTFLNHTFWMGHYLYNRKLAGCLGESKATQQKNMSLLNQLKLKST